MNTAIQTQDDLIQAKQEYLRQLDQEGLRYYQPHAIQESFHRSQADYRALKLGNQGGKSYAGANEILYVIGKVHPWRKNYIGSVWARDCCVNFKVMRAVLIPTYKKLIPRKRCILPWKTYEGESAVWPGLRGGTWKTAWDRDDAILYLDERDGGFIEFKTYDQDVDAHAGPPRHIIRFDEEMPQSIWNENLARQVTTSRNIIITYTPIKHSQWLHAQIEQRAVIDPAVEIFKGSSRNNPHANPDVLDELEKAIVDPAERAARLYGEDAFVSGLVYKQYGDHNWIEPVQIMPEWKKFVFIDPHEDTDTAWNAIAENWQGRAICFAEGDEPADLGIEQICDNIFDRLSDFNLKDISWFCDPSARRRALIRGHDRMIDEFRKKIPLLREAQNSLETGRMRLRRLIVDEPRIGPALVVTHDCPVTDFHMRNHSYKGPKRDGDTRNRPESRNQYSHHPDNLRYYASSRGFSLRPTAKAPNFGMSVYGA